MGFFEQPCMGCYDRDMEIERLRAQQREAERVIERLKTCLLTIMPQAHVDAIISGIDPLQEEQNERI